ncbi:hypothetical protein OAS39_02245 [Pirellulales bacterium]|nr:hypothetical protein [Pirellulales bacterium]
MRIDPVRLVFRLVLVLSATAAVYHVQGEEAHETPAVAPKDGVIQLFNGKDLTGLYTWLADTKYEDPRGVFSVKDGKLHITGNGWGGHHHEGIVSRLSPRLRVQMGRANLARAGRPHS